MESGRESGSSSVDFRTGATTNLGEGEQQLGPSTLGLTSQQDQSHFVPTSLLSELHNTSLDGSKIIITPSEAHPSSNPFGKAHHASPLENNSALSSQNPFLISGATISEKRHDPNDPNNAFSGEISSMHSSLEHVESSSSSSSSSLSLGNPFEVPPTSNTPRNGTVISQNANENHDHMPSGGNNPLGESHVLPSSIQQLEPFFTLEESSQKQQLPNATDDPIDAPQKVEVNSKSASDQSVSRNYSSEIVKNPPVQVMERPGDPPPPAAASVSSSNYVIPSHVFSRNRSSTGQWSNASNESLFSIQMGNMSFSTDMAWYTKSGELDKPLKTCKEKEDIENFPLPPHPQPAANKFNNIGQRTAQQFEGTRVTEEKAAETMREVILEGNITRKGDFSVANGVTHCISHSNSNDHSNHSDGSTKSYAFRVLKEGGDKTLSRKHVEEKQQQQQQQQEGIKETPNASQTAKSTINNASSQNKWLSCFACCH